VRYIKLLTPQAPHVGETFARDIIMTDVGRLSCQKRG